MGSAFFDSGFFTRPGLFDDSGNLPQRWGQIGNALFNLQGDEGDDNVVLKTVTKTALFVTQITLSFESIDNSARSFTLKDGGSSGTTIYKIESGFVIAGDILVLEFATPLKFSTDLHMVRQGSDPYQWNITGWEE